MVSFARRSSVMAAVVAAGAVAAQARAALLITEVMNYPASNENSEYVELYNSGPAAVDLAGYALSRTTSSTVTSTIAAGSIAAGGTAVLVNGNGTDPIGHFQSLWGTSINFIAIPWNTLPNSGATVALLDPSQNTVAGPVNYAAANGFPAATGGPSFYLTDLNAADPTAGSNWALSVVGTDGAYNDGNGSIGSPGVVPAAVPEPASLGLLALGALALLRRR